MEKLGDLITQVKGDLDAILSSHAISPDSIEGIIIIFALAFIAWGIYKKASEFVGWSLAVILLCQVMYWLGQTSFNNLVPVAYVFKYDILAAIAQCFVGTKACDAILYIDAFIRSVSIVVWNTVTPVVGVLGHYFTSVLRDIGDYLKQNIEPLPTEQTDASMSVIWGLFKRI